MLNLEDKFVKVGSENKVKTPFIRFNEYLIYLMYVNKNKVFVSGTHCQLRRCKLPVCLLIFERSGLSTALSFFWAASR